MHLSPGAVLAERYELADRIAAGGMGEVWEATDTRLHRRVAVKVLKPEISADPEFLERFRVEARTAAGLNHPGIAGVYDYGETSTLADTAESTAYLVMELVEGEPLSAVLAREGRIELGVSLDLLEQAAQALQAAHVRGVVHRDVKPGNILITSEGRVKITDFGIAKAVDAAPLTRTGMVLGTAPYLAPEQALGQEATPASDVYSLAVVGYEAVSGGRPFIAESALTVAMMHIRDTPPPLPPGVPVAVRTLLLTALVKDPAQRYQTGAELARAVAAVRAGRTLPMPLGWAGGDPRGIETTTGRTASLPRLTGVERATLPTNVGREAWTTRWLWIVGLLVAGLLALALYLLLTPPSRTVPVGTVPLPGTISTGGAPTASDRTPPPATTGETATAPDRETTASPTTAQRTTASTAAPPTAPTSTAAPPTTAASTTIAPTTTAVPTATTTSAPRATPGAGPSSATTPTTAPVATGNIATAQGRP